MARMPFNGDELFGPLPEPRLLRPEEVPDDLFECGRCGATLWLMAQMPVEHNCAIGEVRPLSEEWPVPMDDLRKASMQAKFEGLREAWDALVATLPLPVRIWGRTIGPYGIRFSAFFRRPR